MSRSALFANAFNDIIQKARKEADAQKSSIANELAQARNALEAAQARVADLEQQLADIDDELAVGLVAAAREAGIKIDLKRAAAAVTPVTSPSDSGRKKPSDTARERAAVLALLKKHNGEWLATKPIPRPRQSPRPIRRR